MSLHMCSQGTLVNEAFVADITEVCKWLNCVLYLDMGINIGSFDTTFVTNYLNARLRIIDF